MAGRPAGRSNAAMVAARSAAWACSAASRSALRPVPWSARRNLSASEAPGGRLDLDWAAAGSLVGFVCRQTVGPWSGSGSRAETPPEFERSKMAGRTGG